jgi:hypothetical protein
LPLPEVSLFECNPVDLDGSEHSPRPAELDPYIFVNKHMIDTLRPISRLITFRGQMIGTASTTANPMPLVTGTS